MKNFLPAFLCLFIFLLASMQAFAQPVDKEREQKAYQEAVGIYQQCTTTSYLSDYHNCSCVAGAFYNARLAKVTITNKSELLGSVLPKCPDLPKIASIKYQQCVGFAKFQRPDNYDDYCKCYGASFARAYEGLTAPLSSIESQLTKYAMKNCAQDYPLKQQTPAERRATRKRLEDAIMN